MSLSTPFVRRPVATTLLTAAITLAGVVAYPLLPVSPLPQVEFPTIQVTGALPGASPETMASAVATPLERQFGRIAGVTEMTSTSVLGATSITLQFDLNRNIDAAARDVQAAINAARGQLPVDLPNNPSYRKVNPADAPIMILALTSSIYDKPSMYDAASTILQQKLSQVSGVGQVNVGGGAPPAVRVEINPTLLNSFGLGLEDIRRTLNQANANRPKGKIEGTERAWTLNVTDQLFRAAEYETLIIAFRNGAPVRLRDVAKVTDSLEDTRAAGIHNGKPAVLALIFRQPGANIIATVDRIRALLPQLDAEIPAGIDIGVVMDRTVTIRESVHHVQRALAIAVVLVILVVFVFLRDPRMTLIPSVAVPVSLIGTFGAMYVMDYSIDNLSLMALAIATGFVVDDAIVVIENISRHIEEGMPPFEASIRGAKEIGFTVLSMSLSLIAVFIPILFMGGIVGRLFREFAVTLSVAIIISLLVSLTTTPVMCARLLKGNRAHGRIYRASEWVFLKILAGYEITLRWVLRRQGATMLLNLVVIAVTVHLYMTIPKGFFPQQDAGRISGALIADQDTSFEAMERLLRRFVNAISEDPAVTGIIAFTGGSGRGGSVVNSGRMFISLAPMHERKMDATAVIGRLRGRLAGIPGGSLFLQPVQDLRTGGRVSGSLYQFTLQGDDLDELNEWGPKVLARLRELPELVDVASDQQIRGLKTELVVDRGMAARLGISQRAIDDVLYDSFGQRQVSTIYKELNQYKVVMLVAPEYARSPEGLRHVYVRGGNGAMVPLSAFAHYGPATTSLAVNHSGQFPSITISFNLRPGVALGSAVDAIAEAQRQMGMPASIQNVFQGTAQAFQESLRNMPLLIAAALLVVYIVLGILYESYIHPITILSTLPSAGLGALVALKYCESDLNVMAIIGILLLIGIVKKNAIMMIDVAVEVERKDATRPEDAIFYACLHRFRPIVMTTMAALLGGLPLALGTGAGSELRRPLGIAIVGGLIVSQILTLYTTPVVYLYLDRFRLRLATFLGRRPDSIDLPGLILPLAKGE